MGVLVFNSSSPALFTGPLTSGPVVAPTYPSQIKLFDVYYIYEPAVGIQILGQECELPPLSLQVLNE